MPIFVFLIVLSILIIVHEWGHFSMAKSLGIKVERFAIGFGPKLFSKVYKNTEFALCLVPLGGYVKMAGDERSQCTGGADEFFSRPPGQRALVVLLGPVVNYILAFLCFWLVFSIGYPTLSPMIGKVLDGYPAQTAGLRPGDKIIDINDRGIQSWDEMQRIVSTSKEKELILLIKRDGKGFFIPIEPKVEQLENIFGQKEDVRLIGIQPEENIITLKYSIPQAAVKATERMVEITTVTYKAIYRMATGAMSAKDSVTGPIGIFYIIKEAASLGFSYVLYVMAIISVSLAIFNLLPFPILDGGHLFLLGVEKLRGKPLSERFDEVINRIGFSLIICLAIFVFYNDFVRYGWIDKIVTYWQKIVS